MSDSEFEVLECGHPWLWDRDEEGHKTCSVEDCDAIEQAKASRTRKPARIEDI